MDCTPERIKNRTNEIPRDEDAARYRNNSLLSVTIHTDFALRTAPRIWLLEKPA